ncbi:MAG: stage III sporulation protein AD [Lachnospiraceae bacterium]|nr:stage III sporulation protein AD [Lachnospiraceae bacterium]
MPDIVKIGFVGIIGAVLALQFKSQKPEFGICIGIVSSILIVSLGIGKLQGILELLGRMKNYLGDTHPYITILIKVVGITYICEFCSGICRDAGYGTVAQQIEIMGKVTVLLAGLPVLLAVVEQMYLFI